MTCHHNLKPKLLFVIKVPKKKHKLFFAFYFPWKTYLYGNFAQDVFHHIYNKATTSLPRYIQAGPTRRKYYIISHTLFYDTRMYHLKPIGLVTPFVHFSRHMNVPYCKFETILKR